VPNVLYTKLGSTFLARFKLNPGQFDLATLKRVHSEEVKCKGEKE
jgi:hypothetical protein